MDNNELEAEKYTNGEEMSTDSSEQYDSDSSSDGVNDDTHAGDMLLNQENPEQAMEANQGRNAESKTKNKVRGLRRLPKMFKDFEESGGKKRILQFDNLGRFSAIF